MAKLSEYVKVAEAAEILGGRRAQFELGPRPGRYRCTKTLQTAIGSFAALTWRSSWRKLPSHKNQSNARHEEMTAAQALTHPNRMKLIYGRL